MAECPECGRDSVGVYHGRADCSACGWYVNLDPDDDSPQPIAGQLDLGLDAEPAELVVPGQSNVIPF